MMQVIQFPQKSELTSLLRRPVMDKNALEGSVREILQTVKIHGDQALKQYAARFDKARLDQVIANPDELEKAGRQVDEKLKDAIRLAYKNIEKFHAAQKFGEPKTETMPGVTCWRESRPIERVGLYIPGGTAPLFSSVLMLAIPARLAGCEEIILTTPPQKDGSIHPVIAWCAELCGIHRVVKAGGAQAIAALAYGTETVPRVDKVFGPGNQYVTMAKQLISMDGVAIDMPAGPSEVAVVADASAHPTFVAIDLLSQAEHGIDSQVLLIATDEEILQKTLEEVDRLHLELPRSEFLKESLGNSKAILVKDLSEAMAISNAYAPEHLILAVNDPEALVPAIRHAGSVFLGHFTPESAGDYASGTNHTLPTNGSARAYSGVSLDSYMRRITFQTITREGLRRLGPAVELMAEAEKLNAHKLAVTLRTNHDD